MKEYKREYTEYTKKRFIGSREFSQMNREFMFFCKKWKYAQIVKRVFFKEGSGVLYVLFSDHSTPNEYDALCSEKVRFYGGADDKQIELQALARVFAFAKKHVELHGKNKK